MRSILLTAACFLLGGAPLFAESAVARMNGWVEGQLSASGNTASAYIFLLVGGALASLLPCVYPLYPITINIIRARSSGRKFAHPLAYFLGIVLMYTTFGVIAAVSGGAFNQVLRDPFANLTIAALLVLLALASAELLMLPMFGGASGDGTRKGLPGTFLMGMSAGLLSSACVGPVVVSILVGLASAAEGVTVAATLGASLKMMCFGIGLGLPFLLLGVLGTSLPKAGKWMKWVQYAFAALILFFAYGYLEKGLLGYGFSEAQSFAVAAGLFLLIGCAFALQSAELFPFQKMRRALLIGGAVVGGLILLRAFLPVAGTVSVAEEAGEAGPLPGALTEQKGNLTWHLDKEAAYAEAKTRGKLVFIDFHGDWCTNCKAFQKLAQTNEELNAALQNAVLLKVYDTSPLFEEYLKDSRLPELKVGLPFFLITDVEGNLVYKTSDYQATRQMVLFLAPQE